MKSCFEKCSKDLVVLVPAHGTESVRAYESTTDVAWQCQYFSVVTICTIVPIGSGALGRGAFKAINGTCGIFTASIGGRLVSRVGVVFMTATKVGRIETHSRLSRPEFSSPCTCFQKSHSSQPMMEGFNKLLRSVITWLCATDTNNVL